MDYYISAGNGKYNGPFRKEDLAKNGVTPETLVWRQGLTSWHPAKDIAEIADFIFAPPPLAPALDQRAALSTPPPLASNSRDALEKELAESRIELERLKQKAITLENVKNTKKTAAGINKKSASTTTTSTTKSTSKTADKKEKKKDKTRYDFPVATWLNEAYTLMACVVVHFLLGITGTTTFFYIYLDIVGAVLCLVGILLGLRIKNLNKISYKDKSTERITADKISYINGLLVSATAAIGFLIILVQSAHYVYVV